jgi:hypothetical protein
MMTLRTGILAAAAALALAVPAAALAQPYSDYGYVRHDEWRRFDRERDWRRAEELRHRHWPRDHDRPYGFHGVYRR